MKEKKSSHYYQWKIILISLNLGYKELNVKCEHNILRQSGMYGTEIEIFKFHITILVEDLSGKFYLDTTV